MGSAQSHAPKKSTKPKVVNIVTVNSPHAASVEGLPAVKKREPTERQLIGSPSNGTLSSPAYQHKAEHLQSIDWQKVLNQASKECERYKGTGVVASYIPALAAVDVNHFGAAIALTTGQVFTVGEADTPFSLQSISKVFSLALAYKAFGDELWKSVGREPSGNAFNSIVQLEAEKGIPRNPFINAGAIVVTDRLHSVTVKTGGACVAIEDLLRSEAGNPSIRVNEVVATSEAETGHRNKAMAQFMHSFGNIVCPVEQVLHQYFRQCAIAASCRDLALAGLYLTRRTKAGETAQQGSKEAKNPPLTSAEAKRVLAIMMTCGTYDGSGEVAFRIGLPAKSGVGGGILAVIPDVGAIAVWSPGLDERGNSKAGLQFLDSVTQISNCSVF